MMYRIIIALVFLSSLAHAGDDGKTYYEYTDEESTEVNSVLDQDSSIEDDDSSIQSVGSDDWGAKPDKWHVAIEGGMAEKVSGAIGKTMNNIRLEIALGYDRNNINGSCRKEHHYRYKGYIAFHNHCTTNKNDNIWNLTAGLYPTKEIVPKIFIYAGGGLGIRFVGHSDTEGIAKLAAGIDVEILDDVFLGPGFKAILALDEGKDEYGVFGGLRYKF